MKLSFIPYNHIYSPRIGSPYLNRAALISYISYIPLDTKYVTIRSNLLLVENAISALCNKSSIVGISSSNAIACDLAPDKHLRHRNIGDFHDIHEYIYSFRYPFVNLFLYHHIFLFLRFILCIQFLISKHLYYYIRISVYNQVLQRFSFTIPAF